MPYSWQDILRTCTALVVFTLTLTGNIAMIRYFSSFDLALAYTKSTGIRMPAPYRRLLFKDGSQVVMWAVSLRLAT